MKTLAILVIILCIIESCSNTQSEITYGSSELCVIFDITDQLLVKPHANSLLALYNFTNHKEQEASFKITTISDKQLNPTLNLHLGNDAESKKQNHSNDPNYRDKLIMIFYDSIRHMVARYDSLYGNSKSIGYSECYRSIADILVEMNKTEVENKFLVIYSDLQENSDLFNCYTQSPFSKNINARQVAYKIDSIYPLPNDLKNITVYVVYQPPTREADKNFMFMCEVYKYLLEKQNAKFIIRTSNSF